MAVHVLEAFDNFSRAGSGLNSIRVDYRWRFDFNGEASYSNSPQTRARYAVK